MPAKSGGRSDSFIHLKQLIKIARYSVKKKIPVDELIEKFSLSENISQTRRNIIKTAGASVLAFIHTPLNAFVKISKNEPSIAIVGAGLAGLTAAYELKKLGIYSDIYEASSRTGGRAYSLSGILHKDWVTEIGAEFINSDHTDLIQLVKELDLELVERKTDKTKKIAYYFEGKHHSYEQVVEAFKPLIEKIISIDDSIDDEIDYLHEANASTYDVMSLADLLDKLKVSGWLRHFIECAYVTEFGLDIDQISCLNFVFTLVGEDPDLLRENFQIYGTSDERYRVKGGISRVSSKLSEILDVQLQMEHELVSIKQRNLRYILSFINRDGSIKEKFADIVILTTPFSVLRNIKINVELPEFKRKSIMELGYGTNTKLFASTNKRIWIDNGFSGEIFAANPVQLVWDNSEHYLPEKGGLTFFFGGTEAEVIAKQDATTVIKNKLWPALNEIIPGFNQLKIESTFQFSWPSYKYSKGSYACYKVGQWTTIAGAEKIPVDRLYFAGEHCSYDHQGMMNGAVESGKQTAKQIASKYFNFEAISS